MYRISKVVLAVLFFVICAQSQQHVGQWNSFTDMKSVRSAVQVGNSMWAATGGGVFVYDTTNGSFTTFTNIDGLDTNDVLAIAFDGAHSIWVGGAGGWVNVYDLDTRQWRTIADIAYRTESTYKGILMFSQQLRIFSASDTLIRGSFQKKVDIIAAKIRKPFGNDTLKSWKVFLGTIE